MEQITTNFAAVASGLETEQVWDIEHAYAYFNRCGQANSRRTAERRLHALGLLPSELSEGVLRDERGRSLNTLVLAWALEQARKRRDRVLFVQLSPLPSGKPCLHANDARGARFWVPLPNLDLQTLRNAFAALQHRIGKPLSIFPHGALVGLLRDVAEMPEIRLCSQAYAPVLDAGIELPTFGIPMARPLGELPAHLKRLEAESIHILREVIAEARKPGMLYSTGKDSCVMLHLARKAFYPSPPPFPLLHVDTGWEFQEMYLFRDLMARESGMELLVHSNAQAIEKQVNPFDHGGALFTDITATQALCQALDWHRFDMVLGGARRDEETSRGKERIFSSRSATHHWSPKAQRPELWGLYNTRQQHNACMRVFPLSNWTELDIWQYIYLERIPVVPLYFSKPRAVIVRPEMIRVVDDDRCRLLPGEQIQIRNVRFRSMGCYPLSGAIESEATTIEDVLIEIANTRQPERQGRTIDTDGAGAMEKRKQEGYF